MKRFYFSVECYRNRLPRELRQIFVWPISGSLNGFDSVPPGLAWNLFEGFRQLQVYCVRYEPFSVNLTSVCLVANCAQTLPERALQPFWRFWHQFATIKYQHNIPASVTVQGVA